MDRHLYTAAAHHDLEFANPLSEPTIGRALGLLALPDGALVIDIGCGKGEIAVRIARRWRGTVDAVDASESMIAGVRARAQGSGVNAVLGDAGAFARAAQAGSYDGAVCIGSSHALGGALPALGEIARLLRPGGEALIGEGVWEREPPPEYLAATGIGRDEMPTLGALAAAAGAAGLAVRWAVTSTQREWDEYEWAHARGIESFAAQNPHHHDTGAMLARSRGWRAAYLAHGRGVLGFALLICRRAPEG